ncbi:hypothetical protein BKA70DRAFT_1447150 [Coprinopsis sp. MPI-PUGE-AT-0042]|nr:hypothetical protein BKA70DRAFT_1447150 [Coprinopsis sp. MPI-PUGE-AT-0042]
MSCSFRRNRQAAEGWMGKVDVSSGPEGSKANIAVLNPSYSGSNGPDVHPVHYARVEGIFHTNIVSVTSDQGGGFGVSERIDFLWVRWLTLKGRSMGAEGLDLLSLPPLSDASCFGFINPKSVVRECHLVPKFSKDRAKGQNDDAGDDQIKAFFLNPFVLDRALQHPRYCPKPELP